VIAKVLLGVIVALLLALAVAGWQLDRARKARATAEANLETAATANREYAEAISRLNAAHAEELADRKRRLEESDRALKAIEERKPRTIIRRIAATQSVAGHECETSKQLLDTFLRDSDK
jgi:Tfp pilus assembly protein PilE